MNSFNEPSSVLVLGGASDLGAAITGGLVRRGARRVILAGRDETRLGEAASLLPSGSQVKMIKFDALDAADHPRVIEEAFAEGDIDLVLLAFGLLGGESSRAGTDVADAVEVARVNYVAAVSVSLLAAERLRDQGKGVIVVLSSVAGERVRRSNFVYGSSKAGLDGFAQGLGDALQGSGARVLIVRPGFVRTKMTAGRRDAPFATDAETVATAVIRALQRNQEVIWVPPVLRWVMVIARHLPRAVFRRLPW